METSTARFHETAALITGGSREIDGVAARPLAMTDIASITGPALVVDGGLTVVAPPFPADLPEEEQEQEGADR